MSVREITSADYHNQVSTHFQDAYPNRPPEQTLAQFKRSGFQMNAHSLRHWMEGQHHAG